MTVEGVDFSWARPGGAALRAAGKAFVIRYVPYQLADGSWTGKGLTAAEIRDYRANGLAICLVFESTAGRALSAGSAGGEADARTSQAAVARLGMPADLPVYFAVDRDVSAADWPAIDAYLDGAASVLGRARVGAYGEKSLMDHLQATGKARWLWQTYAWSGGVVDTNIHLLQYNNGETINGGSVDLCRAYTADYGQWPAPAQEGDMANISQYLPGYAADLGLGARIRTEPKLAATVLRTVDNEQWPAIIGWAKGELTAGSDEWLMRWANGRYEYTHKVNVDKTWNPTPFATGPLTQAQADAQTAAATAPLKAANEAQAAQINEQSDTIKDLEVALAAAPGKEKDRIAAVQAARAAAEIQSS